MRELQALVLENRTHADGLVTYHDLRRLPGVFGRKGKYQVLLVEAAVESPRRGDRRLVRKLSPQAGDEGNLGVAERRSDETRPAQVIFERRPGENQCYQEVWDKKCLQSNP